MNLKKKKIDNLFLAVSCYVADFQYIVAIKIIATGMKPSSLKAQAHLLRHDGSSRDNVGVKLELCEQSQLLYHQWSS